MERPQGRARPTYVALGTVARPLKLPRLSPAWSAPKSTTCRSDYGILWGHDKRKVWCRTQGSGQFAGGSETKSGTLASLNRLFPTLPPSAIVIRLGVAMVTGEVT